MNNGEIVKEGVVEVDLSLNVKGWQTETIENEVHTAANKKCARLENIVDFILFFYLQVLFLMEQATGSHTLLQTIGY